jgi:DHA2 family multidrug resistance protein
MKRPGLTSYLVANAVVLPATGWRAVLVAAGDYLHRIFTVASAPPARQTVLVLIGTNPAGAGGGASDLQRDLETFPPAKRGTAMSVYAMG